MILNDLFASLFRMKRGDLRLVRISTQTVVSVEFARMTHEGYWSVTLWNRRGLPRL